MSDEIEESSKKPLKTALLILWRIVLVVVIIGSGIGLMSRLAAMKKPTKQSKVAAEIPLVVTEPLQL